MNMKKNILKERRTTSRDGIPGTVTFGLEYLNGNTSSHWTVTAWYKGKGQEFGGCCHDEILAKEPDLAPFVALHLSDSDGSPMHAEDNGWYWLAGALGGLDERYHGGNSQPAKSPDECLRIFAEHARVSPTVARELADKIGQIWSTKGNAKQEFHAWIEAQRPRWRAESDNARKLLATL